MHRNTFLNAPQVLNQDFSFKQNPNLFFAGQITGVEGYMESASSGILAGINAVNRKHGASALILPKETMMGGFKRPHGEQCFQKLSAHGGKFWCAACTE